MATRKRQPGRAAAFAFHTAIPDRGHADRLGDFSCETTCNRAIHDSTFYLSSDTDSFRRTYTFSLCPISRRSGKKRKRKRTEPPRVKNSIDLTKFATDAQNNRTVARRALCRVLRRNDALLPCARDRRRQDRPFASVYRRRPAPRAFGSLVPDYPTTVRTDFPHFGARASPESFPAAFRPTARTSRHRKATMGESPLFPARPSPAGFPFLTGIRTKTSPGFQAAARIRRPYAIAYGR